MNLLKDKKKRKIFIVWSAVVFILAATVIAMAIYLGSYYEADDAAIEAYIEKSGFSYFENDGMISYMPYGAKCGLVFYPGGKVEYTAYIPLMQALAERGIASVLLEMPFNLAVFDIDAAEGVCEDYPQIKNWYIGGHSLGGSMAASYLSDNPDEFSGLILLGSYSASDLSQSSLSVLSVYGECDGVMNREKYEENRANLPSGFSEAVIEGGNHAYFGMYGEQEGDGAAGISNTEQIMKTAEIIANFVVSE